MAEHAGEPSGQSSGVSGPGANGVPEGSLPAAAGIEGDLYCPKCGYNLRTLTGDRCPECGYDIRIIRQRKSQIPWIYRDKEGSFRAYWKTVWLVMFRNERFCLEIGRPVDLRHARRFRRVTIVHAYLPMVLLTVAALLFGRLAFSPEWCVYIAVIHVGIFACIAAITVVPYYALYHRDVPIEMQHRAAVLTLYACAPLAWVFVVAVLVVAGMIATETRRHILDMVLYLAAISLLASLPGIMLAEVLRLIKRMLPQGRVVLWISVKLVALWLAAALLTLVGIPVACAFLAVVYYSLR